MFRPVTLPSTLETFTGSKTLASGFHLLFPSVAFVPGTRSTCALAVSEHFLPEIYSHKIVVTAKSWTTTFTKTEQSLEKTIIAFYNPP